MISSLSIAYRDDLDLDKFPTEFMRHPPDKVLIQVFSGVLDEGKIAELIGKLTTRFPGAAILGTTTSGEILAGESLDHTTVISMTCFEQSTVRCALVSQNEDLSDAGRQLASRLQQADTKALIIFGCGIKDKRTIFGQPLLEALHQKIPEAVIAGGQAGDNGRGTETLVFTAEGITGHGVAAASIAGTELIAHNAYTLSWVPLGKVLTITHAEGSRVFTIDGRSPYDIYCHYLGQEVADGLPLSAADFPLMIERDGVLMAIHATGVNPDGSFDYIHHFHAGEQLRFGYCHAGLLALGAQSLCKALSTEPAQAAFVYACVSRKWILGADVLLELKPIDTVAPSAGFFCYGEYFGHAQNRPLFLSQTLTVLCLAENDGEVSTVAVSKQQAHPQNTESRQFKTMRVLHRLVEVSTREIDTMNHELASLSQRDSLTGLANRRLLDDQLSREIHRLTRSSSPLSIIMLDVDHFKLYNDTYGHVLGDDCLCAIAQVLKKMTQRAADLAVRFGGEEFALILPELSYAEAMLLADAIRQEVEQLDLAHSASPTAPRVTISAGVFTAAVAKNSDPHFLLEQADKQLYLAKQGGRNRVFGLDRTDSVI